LQEGLGGRVDALEGGLQGVVEGERELAAAVLADQGLDEQRAALGFGGDGGDEGGVGEVAAGVEEGAREGLGVGGGEWFEGEEVRVEAAAGELGEEG
jgi:hypothetical protein